ncbi:MFS transporter [Thalassospira marina]|nr:MFS transporter [Thalassospira marina]
MSASNTADAPFRLRRPLVFAMAAATGIAVANIYYNQPMLNIISHDLPAASSLISPVTQLGYALGLFLLVPLGDMINRRKLVLVQFLVLAAALALLAGSTTTAMIVGGSILVGMTATVAQQIIPYAAHLSAPEKRGATVGTIMSGLLAGILLSRAIAGYVATGLGWRAMFIIAVPVAVIAAITMFTMLPDDRKQAPASYPKLMGSMRHLWRDYSELRRAALTQALLFAGFSAFWTVLPFLLAQPQFNMGAEIAGLFGIVGMVGVMAAPIAGRLADHRGPRIVVRLGVLVALASWVLFATSTTITSLVIGVILLDFGMQSALVSNQHIIYSLEPAARARINTIFMATMFLGGAAGSALAIWVWHHGGWINVCEILIAASVLAVIMQVRAPRTIQNAQAN